jgi:hypothetical protein
LLRERQKDDQPLPTTIDHFIEMFSHDVETVHNFFDTTLVNYEHELDGIIENIQEREETGFEFTMGDKTILRTRLVTLYRQMEFLYSFLHMNRIAIRDLRDKFENAMNDSESENVKKVLEFTDNNAFDSTEIKRVMERTEVSFILDNVFIYIAFIRYIIYRKGSPESIICTSTTKHKVWSRRHF